MPTESPSDIKQALIDRADRERICTNRDPALAGHNSSPTTFLLDGTENTLPLPKSLQPGSLLYAPSREAVLTNLDLHYGKRAHCYKHDSKWFFLRRTADKHCSKKAWAEVVAYDTAMGLVLSPAYAAAFAGAVVGGCLAFGGAIMAASVTAAVFAVPAMVYEPLRRATPLRKYPNRLNQAAWSGANLVVGMTKTAAQQPVLLAPPVVICQGDVVEKSASEA